MTTSSRIVSTALTYLGALPFWLLAFAPSTVLGFDTASVFLSYGAAIASFMAGALWGGAQSGSGDLRMILASNALALSAFATLVASPLLIALFVQLMLFALLLIADHRSTALDSARQWYWKLRVRVTLLVALGYCVMLFRNAPGSLGLL